MPTCDLTHWLGILALILMLGPFVISRVRNRQGATPAWNRAEILAALGVAIVGAIAGFLQAPQLEKGWLAVGGILLAQAS